MAGGATVALCVIALVLTTGCATRIRHVPLQPLTRQTTTVMERDQRECEAAITGTLKGVWFPAEVEFAGCMIARNYQVYVQLLDASVEVRKRTVRAKVPPARIVEDLVSCERAVSNNLSWTEKIGRPAIAVAGFFFWPASVGGLAASIFLPATRERDYADCMRPLGYVVTPWQRGPDDPTYRAASEDRAAP